MVTPIWKGSPNFFTQNGVPKLFITMHWMVGTLSGTDAAFSRAGGVSATYGVEGPTIHQYVQEKDYPFSDGNTYANKHTISIEHAGGWLLPDGSRFKPTAQTHEMSAQLCADIARRHGFGKLVIGVNMFPHNHWVATACPGTLDIGWIANRANQINGDPSTAGTGGVPISSTSRKKKVMEFRVITESGIGVVYGETTFVEIDPKTDPIEFAASESAHGAGADRMYLTENEWRIEKIQITKRREQGNTAAIDYDELAAAIVEATPPAKTLIIDLKGTAAQE